jgi:hypothetical protein
MTVQASLMWRDVDGKQTKINLSANSRSNYEDANRLDLDPYPKNTMERRVCEDR